MEEGRGKAERAETGKRGRKHNTEGLRLERGRQLLWEKKRRKVLKGLTC